MHREWRPWRLEPPRFRLPAPLLAVVAPIAYFLTGILAASLSVKTDYVVTLWPPAAILVASLLRAPRSTWPALVALFLLADSAMGMLASGKIAAALIVSAANIGEGLIIAGTLQRLSYEGKWYLSGRWIATFLVSSVTAATVVAGVGSTILSFMDTGQFTMSWMSWAMADCLSVLTLAPFLLCWTEPSLRQGLRRRDWAEAVALTLILGAISYAALTTPLPLLFLIFPFLALTTVRSGLLGATAGTVTVALVGLWLTVQGSGPFAAAPGLSAVGHVIILQLFILAAALCAVPLAIVFTMRKSLAEEVQHHASIKRAALDNMAQGLIMFDAEQRLIICNRRYGELYKLPRNLRIHRTWRRPARRLGRYSTRSARRSPIARWNCPTAASSSSTRARSSAAAGCPPMRMSRSSAAPRSRSRISRAMIR
jgi:integral membrane sensor domain MASE1